MRVASVQEFSLLTVFEFQNPIPFAEAKLDEMAKSICASPVGYTTNPLEIAILRHNHIFSYSLTVPLFNHGGQIVVTGQAVSINFKQGRGSGQLGVMVDVTLGSLEAIKPPRLKRSVITFAAHATFENPEQYSEYMSRYVNEEAGITSGGVTLVAKSAETDGEIRYATEKSLSYPNALFFSTTITSTKELDKELFALVANRFDTVAGHDGIKIIPFR